MQGLWKSIVGEGSRKMTILGIGAILASRRPRSS